MIAEIQSKITQLNADILTLNISEFKERVKYRCLKAEKQRIGIISCLPIDEITEDDLNLIYGE